MTKNICLGADSNHSDFMWKLIIIELKSICKRQLDRDKQIILNRESCKLIRSQLK